MSAVTEATQTASPSRPGSLTAAIGLAVLTAVAAIVNGVIIITGGLDLVKEIGSELIAAETGVGEAEVAEVIDFDNPMVDALFAEAASTYETRAYLVLGAGVLLALFGLLMRKAGMAMRVLVTVTAAVTILFAAVIGLDAGTTVMIGLAWVAVLGAVVTIVTTWLPANGRYAKTLR